MEGTAALVATIFAGATGAAVIKLIDNVILWFLARKAKKEDSEDTTKAVAIEEAKVTAETAKQQLEAHEEWAKDRIDLLCDCISIFAIEQITTTCKWAIHDKQISLNDLQRIHVMYAKAHAIGVNGDLKYLLSLVEELPIVDPLQDNEHTVTERKDFYDLA